MQILYTDKAEKQLKKITRKDLKSAKLIVMQIEKYALNPFSGIDIKIIKGEFEIFKKLKVGNYRVIFDVVQNVVQIHDIKLRQETKG